MTVTISDDGKPPATGWQRQGKGKQRRREKRERDRERKRGRRKEKKREGRKGKRVCSFFRSRFLATK